MTPLPCITLIQPWASMVAAGWKPIESRSHDHFKGLKGRRIGIHAGKKWDEHALEFARHYLRPDQVMEAFNFQHIRGVLVCTAYVADHRLLHTSDSEAACFTVPDRQLFGLVLRDIQPIFPVMPMRGAQGIWNSPIDINIQHHP